MINWKVRIKNKTFWITAVPAVLLLIQAVAALAGFTLNLDALGDKIITVVNAAFVVLAILGVVADPTTAGVGDKELESTYIDDRRDIEDQ